MAFPQFYVTHSAGLFVTANTLTLTHLLFFHLVFVDTYKYSFFQITVSDCRKMFDPNHLLSLFVLDQSKIISEPWHSGSNRRMSIAGYLPKN